MSRALALILVLCGAACTSPCLASEATTPDASESAPLRIDERGVVEIALRTHPSIAAMDVAIQSAQSIVAGSQWALAPDLGLTVRYSRLSDIPEQYRTLDGIVFPVPLHSFSGQASLTIPVSDMFLSLASEVRAARLGEKALQIEKVMTRARIAFEARMSYFEFWRWTSLVQTAETAVQAAEANLRDQRTRAQEGVVARNEVLPFETALDEAVVRLEIERSELARAEATLRALAPELGSHPLQLPDEASIHAPTVSPPTTPSGNPPELEWMERQTRAANERIQGADWSMLPRLFLLGNADLSSPSPRVLVAPKHEPVASWEVSAQLQWSLSQLAAGKVRSAQARQEFALLVARREEVRRQLEARRAAALASLSAATARAARAREQVSRAAALAKARRGELAAGTALPLAVVNAETDLVRAKSESITAYVAMNAACAELDFIEGHASPMALTQGTR